MTNVMKYRHKKLALFRETGIGKKLNNDSIRHTKKVASLPGLKLH